MSDHLVSHGRGGAANISKDSTEYTDGGIVREGYAGDQGDGAFSTGRGGQGNIGSPSVKPTKGEPHDRDVVPETSMRSSTPDNYHFGRGGEGNAHHQQHEGDKEHVGLADKLKNKLFKKDQKEG